MPRSRARPAGGFSARSDAGWVCRPRSRFRASDLNKAPSQPNRGSPEQGTTREPKRRGRGLSPPRAGLGLVPPQLKTEARAFIVAARTSA